MPRDGQTDEAFVICALQGLVHSWTLWQCPIDAVLCSPSTDPRFGREYVSGWNAILRLNFT